MTKLAFVLTLVSAASLASAQPAEPTPTPPTPTPPTMPTAPTVDPNVAPTPPPEEPKKKSTEPKRGDFNAGGQARFPSGPDEDGKYASFNWVAADLKARYYLLKQVTVDANVPLAIIHPDTAGPMGPEPSTFGGFTLTLDARFKAPKFGGMKYDTTVGLTLTGGYMKEGAMLLSDKDFPLYTGDLKPGFAGGLVSKVSLSNVLAFSLIPTWVYQSGTMESLQAIQVPIALQVGLGNVLKINFELGIYTGDDYSIRPSNGGRLASGLSIDLKISHILIHAGAGFASLLVADSGLYPTIKDSFYIDLNAKYAK